MTIMILLRITGYGWTAIAFIVLSVLLAISIIKRTNRKPGCVGIGYVALVVFCLLSLSASLAGVLGGFVINAFTLPRYQAKVVSTTSYQDRDSQKRTVTMYRSIVAFTPKDGTPVEMRTDVSSSGKREIGEEVTVIYEPGMTTAQELSTSKYLLMAGGAVLLLVMGYFALGGILYAIGVRMPAYYRFGLGLLMYFIFPLAMLFMLGGMGYAVVLYFMGMKPDMPIWAVVVCIFFCLVLLAAMAGYFRMLTERRQRLI